MADRNPQPRATRRQMRYQPKDPRRVKYYKASLVASIVFVLAAALFPLWLDYVRSHSQAAPAEPVPREVTAIAPQQAVARATRARRRDTESVRRACQTYVSARCKALGIEEGDCGKALAVALALKDGATMVDCVMGVKAPLRELSDMAKKKRERQTLAGPADVGRGEGSRTKPHEGARPTMKPRVDREERKKPVKERKAVPPNRLLQQDRRENLTRIYELVRQIQMAAQNYATPKAAQAARFAELRQRVEKDGSREVVELYNKVLHKFGRTAGREVEAGEPQLETSPDKVTTDAVNTEYRPRNPELEELGKVMSDQGMSPPAEPGPPAAVEPGRAVAPPAREP